MDSSLCEENVSDAIFADIDKTDLLSLSLPFDFDIEMYRTQDLQVYQEFDSFSGENVFFPIHSDFNPNQFINLSFHTSTQSSSELYLEGLSFESVFHSHKPKNKKTQCPHKTNAEKCKMYRIKK